MNSSARPASTEVDPVTPCAENELKQATDEKLRDRLVALEHVIVTAQAEQAEVIAEIAARAEQADAQAAAELMCTPQAAVSSAKVTGSQSLDFVADELALSLHISRAAAGHRLTTAMAACSYEEVRQAWRAGLIDGSKAHEIADQVRHIDRPGSISALAVPPLLQAAVDYAQSHTRPQLRAWLQRRVLAVAPEVADVRAKQAMTERRVVITPQSDGMAELWALLPAGPALQLKKILDKAAQATRSCEGQPRDIRSADERRADTFVDLILGEAPAPRIDLTVLASADTLAGTGRTPAELAGHGALTSGQLAALITNLADDACPETSGLAPDATMSSDADAVVALANYSGPITLRVATVDAESGHVVPPHVSEEGYRPSVALDRNIRLRDVTCRFPGCRRSALGSHSGVDLDHTVAWPAGATTPGNLAALCRHHHRLKHHPDWQLRQDADGSLIWTTPVGRTSATPPWPHHLWPQPQPPPDG